MSSTPGSSKLPIPPPISRTSTTTTKPPRPFHSSSHSRSRSHLAHPKVLPFPDLPVRATSREASPMPTRQNSQRLSADGSMANAGGSSDGVSSSGEARGFGSSNSPPIHSPLARASTPQLAVGGLSWSNRPESATRLLFPARTEGFHSTPTSPSTFAIIPPSPNAAGASPSRSPAPLPSPAPSIAQSTPGLATKGDPAPPTVPPLSAPVTSPPPPNLVVDHLYQSFLKGTCADVRVWVRKWGVAWHVHRMILVQAGLSSSRCTDSVLIWYRLLPFAFPRRLLRDSDLAGDLEGQREGSGKLWRRRVGW